MNNPVFSLSDFCQAITLPAEKTLISWFWTLVPLLWSWYGILIITTLSIWVLIEIKTRFGNFHYNSENGYSPLFNRVVGGGVYALLQALVYLFFKLIFGGIAYCLPFPYIFHLLVFAFTGKFLNIIGFWHRLEKPNRNRRWRKRY